MTATMPPGAQVFFSIFNELGFPLIACDLRRLSWGLRAHPNGPSHLKVPLSLAPATRRAELSAAFGGFFSAIEPTIDDASSVRRELVKREKDLASAFDAMVAKRHDIMVFEIGDNIAWEEDSLWPLACSGIFQQLSNLLVLHRRLIENRIAQIPGVTVLSEYPRHLPTDLHYAFGSLGAWIGGAANVQFFGLHATRAASRDNLLNASYAREMGYDEGDVSAIAGSGLVALPDTTVRPLLAAQQITEIPVIGSIPTDEFNVANPPAPETPGPRRAGYLIDTHYRTCFNARDLGPLGWYGARNVLRDHYRDFYQSHAAGARLVRCKHYCVPVIDVSSRGEVERIVSDVPLHGEDGLFYRGQGRLYLLERDSAVRRLLFADSCSSEPSLPTAASRTEFQYDSLHFALRSFLGGLLDDSEPLPASASPGANSAWQDACESASCELDYALMALAQHYGIATHGLDVTTEIDVALWFALNRFERNAEGRSSYWPMTPADWNEDAGQWPIVFVCQHVTHSVATSLHECHELEAYGLKAARPSAQAAKFFLGGHSDHRNRLAETLVCALRLAPADYEIRSTFETLFPAPEDDPAYRLMLEFSARPPYRALGAQAVNVFHA